MDDNKEKMKIPGTQEKTAPVDEKAAIRQKLHKRHMRALRDILIRLGMLLLVVYILFFHLVGVTKMPSGDMYPRIDAGDFVHPWKPRIRSIKKQKHRRLQERRGGGNHWTGWDFGILRIRPRHSLSAAWWQARGIPWKSETPVI